MNRKSVAIVFVGLIVLGLVSDCLSQREGRGRRGGGRRGVGGGRRGGGEGRRGGGGGGRRGGGEGRTGGGGGGRRGGGEDRRGGGGGVGVVRTGTGDRGRGQRSGGAGGIGDIARRALGAATGLVLAGAAADYATGLFSGGRREPFFDGGGFRFGRPAVVPTYPRVSRPIIIGRRRGRRRGFGRQGFRPRPFFFSF